MNDCDHPNCLAYGCKISSRCGWCWDWHHGDHGCSYLWQRQWQPLRALQMQQDLYGCGMMWAATLEFKFASSTSQESTKTLQSRSCLTMFDQQFGNVQERGRPGVETGLCVLGMEPSPQLRKRLQKLEEAYQKRGWLVHIYPFAIVCCFCWGKGNEVWVAWWCGIRHCIKTKFNVVEYAKGLCQTTMQSSCMSHCYEIALDETFDKRPRQSPRATLPGALHRRRFRRQTSGRWPQHGLQLITLKDLHYWGLKGQTEKNLFG